MSSIKREFNKVGRTWYSKQPDERLVLVYDFKYNPCEDQKDYNRQLLSFINMVDLTVDKIIMVENVGEGHDRVHAYGDGGIERNAIVRFINTDDENQNMGINTDHSFAYLGEIPNMPGYCIVVDVTTGITHVGCRTEQFAVVNEII